MSTEKPEPNGPSPAIRLYRFQAYSLWQAQKGLCFYCVKPMLLEANWEDPMLASRDHFIPRCLGAPLRNNFVFACRRCNTKHGDTLPTVKELERFIELYGIAKMNPQWVRFRLGELGVQVLQTAMERALVT